jgi:branched-chain amino acid aminotransferase
MALQWRIDRNPSPVDAARRAEILAQPGFGRHFTDHMVTAVWTPDAGWHDALIGPYRSLSLDPATQVFHYGQAIFEGFKAYRQPDGAIATFRPEGNAERFVRSAHRLALPELPVEDFVAAADALIEIDQSWVPSEPETSLYLRPFMMATEVGLGVRPAQQVTFLLIASPAGAYFAGGRRSVTIWLSEDYTRAAPGGTGAAKCSGNYAASLMAQQEAIDNGCDQVVFLDAVERRWVEELGGMNLWFVYDDGVIATPELSGSILEGITRDSLIQLARDRGHTVEERRIDVDEWRKGVESGRVVEVFACGTAAVITSLGELRWSGGSVAMREATPVADRLREDLVGIQYGRLPDAHGWLHPVVAG